MFVAYYSNVNLAWAPCWCVGGWEIQLHIFYLGGENKADWRVFKMKIQEAFISYQWVTYAQSLNSNISCQLK